MRTLSLSPLTPAAFAPFGEVIDAEAPCETLLINEGHSRRHHRLADIDCNSGDGHAAISLFRASPVPIPFVLRSLERHPLGSQAFLNLGASEWIVVVAPPGPLEEAAIRGFLAGPDQGVSYRRGTWHHYLLVLDSRCDFAVVDRVGPGENCDEQTLRAPLRLESRS